MRLKQLDNFIIATMGIIAFASLYMLYGTKFLTAGAKNEIRVASIVEQIKIVKRKKDFYQSWLDVKPGDDLVPNDEIYTHGQSSAKINFINGPQINLSENSLLRIKTLKKENTLTLERGNLTAKLTTQSPKLDIVLDGKKYSFESKNAAIQIEQGNTENKFVLLDGKAKLNMGERKEELASNQVLVQNKKTGDLKIKQLPFIQKYPANNLISYYNNQNKEIIFQWSYTVQTMPAKLLISENSSFDKIVVNENVDQNHYSHRFDRPGTFYWKLSSADNIDGPIRSFTLRQELPLSIYVDKDIIYKEQKKAEKVFINWSSDNTKKYLLKIKSPDKEIKNINLTKNNYELNDLQVGNYQFSVKVNDADRPEALWSEAVALEVLEAKSINIVSTTPDLIEKINYNNRPITCTLTWNGPRSGVNYKLIITKNNISTKLITENTNYTLNLKEPGEYKWEVVGETPSGMLSNTILGKILLKVPRNLSQAPSEGAVIELERPDQLVSFKWDQVENNPHYQFELSTESNFQNIIYEKEIESNKISTVLAKVGKYFWRVKIKKGNSVEYSTPVSVEIKPTPPLERPEISPSIKIKIKYLDKKSSMNSIWDFFIASASASAPVAIAEWDLPANSRAKNYIVEIYEDQKLSKLLTKVVTPTPHVTWENATAGTFYWRVSYEDFWGRKTEFSKISTLSIELDLPPIAEPVHQVVEKTFPTALILLTPKHNETIFNMVDDETIFSWSDIPNVKYYQVKIATDLDFENMLFTTKADHSQLKIHCKVFGEKAGEYYWKVSSDIGNVSKRRKFQALCTPKKVEAPIVKVAPSPIPQIKIKNKKYIRFGILPHHLSYKNKTLEYSAKVSGNVLNSWYGLYQTPVNWKYFHFFNTTIFLSRGKVFNTITFTDFELNFKAYKLEQYFSWGPVVAFMKKTFYVESNRTITGASQTMPLAGISIQKDFGHIFLNAEAKFGGALDLHTDLLVDLKKNISVGAFFNSTTLTKDGNKHIFSRLGLNLSYTFPLLENKK